MTELTNICKARLVMSKIKPKIAWQSGYASPFRLPSIWLRPFRRRPSPPDRQRPLVVGDAPPPAVVVPPVWYGNKIENHLMDLRQSYQHSHSSIRPKSEFIRLADTWCPNLPHGHSNWTICSMLIEISNLLKLRLRRCRIRKVQREIVQTSGGSVRFCHE